MTFGALAPKGDVAVPAPEVGGIPIRNIWHMLVYTWSEDADQRMIRYGRFNAEDAPTLDALLALLLANMIAQRLRIGLGRGYVADLASVRGVRGRIDFSNSLKRLSFQQGMAYCRFEKFEANVTRNQIIRSTLARMVQVGEFGLSNASALRQRLRRLVRDLGEIDLIEVSLGLIRRQRLTRDQQDYRLMLAVCELFWERQMPTEADGNQHAIGIRRDALTLHRIYERFVAQYFRTVLSDWHVWPQKFLKWPAESSSEHLPGMKPDLVLEHKLSGRRVVLDTKYTANSLLASRYGDAQIFNSANLYQIYTYLRTQDQSEAERKATGILLYPTVKRHLDEKMLIQGHPIRIASVDLAAPWQDIEARLLEVLN